MFEIQPAIYIIVPIAPIMHVRHFRIKLCGIGQNLKCPNIENRIS